MWSVRPQLREPRLDDLIKAPMHIHCLIQSIAKPLFLQFCQPRFDSLWQSPSLGLHIFQVAEERQSPSILVIALQQSRAILDLGGARKYKPDTVLLIQVEHHNVSFVFLGIERLQFIGIEKRRGIPLRDRSVGEIQTYKRADYTPDGRFHRNGIGSPAHRRKSQPLTRN